MNKTRGTDEGMFSYCDRIQKRVWTILVPATQLVVPGILATREEIPIYHHQEWDEEVKKIAGGLTIMHSAKGLWMNSEGATLSEKMIPVLVICDREDILEIVKMTKDHYRQESILYYKVSDEVYFYTGKDA